jgi:DNA processing protein
MSEPSDLIDLVALSLLPLGCRRRARARLHAARPAVILEQMADEDARFSDALRRRLGPAALRARAHAAIARAAQSGIAAVPWSAPAYPAALAAIADPPPVLWARGDLAALSRPAVAIVGSRDGTPYGLSVAERLAADLASRGVAIVSGLARGVDSAAHRGALSAAGGSTLAVLGSGADVVYPAEHRELARRVERSGAVLSELVPGTPPRKPFFPLRNRVISGLSRAVVIVEAGERSGSLITARCALEQGREVLAVPGNILTGRNRGGHALLKDGAKIVESADDILEELGIRLPGGPAPASLAGPEDLVLRSLPAGEACDLDAIAERTGLAPPRLLPRLFELELQGLVRRAGGGRFVRV